LELEIEISGVGSIPEKINKEDENLNSLNYNTVNFNYSIYGGEEQKNVKSVIFNGYHGGDLASVRNLTAGTKIKIVAATEDIRFRYERFDNDNDIYLVFTPESL
jgi:hypothetical protein